ncbi:MAG: hypothetical protein IJX20_05535 [Alphaproteobacteria bacterium]|nr:hypothetical protein [Alphaproteobacteria bacterium]
MKNIIFYSLIICLCFLCRIVSAQFISPKQNYSGMEAINHYFSENSNNRNKSIIYVFYNNNSCPSCLPTIDLIEKIYNSYYANQYSLFIINYQNPHEYNFIETYNLRQPLEVVLVRINDGAVFGYKKLRQLQDEISDPISFTENFRFQINEFLGNCN